MAGNQVPERLDVEMVGRGMVATRSRARDLIERGKVSVDGIVALKPALKVGAANAIAVEGDEAGLVSRGGVKLRAALGAFGFDAAGRVALDVGASTGGFTQALLAAGAAKVYAVDVGHGQLHETLRADPRVVMLEGTDARALTREIIPEPVGIVVADVSFISLEKALGVPLSLAGRGAWLVALVKPQFEVGRALVGKGGIVRDEEARLGAVEAVARFIRADGVWDVKAPIQSPIEGGSGNVEYLLGAVRRG